MSMSVGLFAVLALLLPAAGPEFVDDHSDDPPATDDGDGDGNGDGWAADAVLDVAFYLRLHKFDDFDRRWARRR